MPVARQWTITCDAPGCESAVSGTEVVRPVQGWIVLDIAVGLDLKCVNEDCDITHPLDVPAKWLCPKCLDERDIGDLIATWRDLEKDGTASIVDLHAKESP